MMKVESAKDTALGLFLKEHRSTLISSITETSGGSVRIEYYDGGTTSGERKRVTYTKEQLGVYERQ